MSHVDEYGFANDSALYIEAEKTLENSPHPESSVMIKLAVIKIEIKVPHMCRLYFASFDESMIYGYLTGDTKESIPGKEERLCFVTESIYYVSKKSDVVTIIR